MDDMVAPLVGYALVFVVVGAGFILVHLLIGKLIRPHKPDAEKKTVYECGEPTIGSAWIQFDLRFYVVALLFVIFDVEVAFFFPWAEVFGKANALSTSDLSVQEREQITGELSTAFARFVKVRDRLEAIRLRIENGENVTTNDIVKEIAEVDPSFSLPRETDRVALVNEGLKSVKKRIADESNPAAMRRLAWLALFEVLVFFGVLLVGFAYLWRRGDLQWVRSTLAERPTTPAAVTAAPSPETPREPAAPLVGAGSATH
jgi:NADH-quinone oxidoreductase subunit A